MACLEVRGTRGRAREGQNCQVLQVVDEGNHPVGSNALAHDASGFTPIRVRSIFASCWLGATCASTQAPTCGTADALSHDAGGLVAVQVQQVLPLKQLRLGRGAAAGGPGQGGGHAHHQLLLAAELCACVGCRRRV